MLCLNCSTEYLHLKKNHKAIDLPVIPVINFRKTRDVHKKWGFWVLLWLHSLNQRKLWAKDKLCLMCLSNWRSCREKKKRVRETWDNVSTAARHNLLTEVMAENKEQSKACSSNQEWVILARGDHNHWLPAHQPKKLTDSKEKKDWAWGLISKRSEAIV